MLGLRCCTGFSLAVASSCGAQASHCGDLSCFRARAGVHEASVAAAPGSGAGAHRLSCPEVCGILPDQELNLHLMHWQASSLPLSHQGSPLFCKLYHTAVPIVVPVRWKPPGPPGWCLVYHLPALPGSSSTSETAGAPDHVELTIHILSWWSKIDILISFSCWVFPGGPCQAS